MKRYLLSVAVLLTFLSNPTLQAQGDYIKLAEHNFDTIPVMPEVPTELIDEPIIVLEKETTVKYGQRLYNVAGGSQWVTYKHVLVNEAPDDDYLDLINAPLGMYWVNAVDARIIRGDTVAEEFTPEELLGFDGVFRTFYNYSTELNIYLPGLADGDRVEFIFTIQNDIPNRTFFNDKWPVLNSQIRINYADSHYEEWNTVVTKDINGAPPADTVFPRKNVKQIRYMMTDLEAVPVEVYGSRENKFPMVLHDGMRTFSTGFWVADEQPTGNWLDLIKPLYHIVSDEKALIKSAEAKYLDKFYDNLWQGCEDAVCKMDRFQTFFNDSITILTEFDYDYTSNLGTRLKERSFKYNDYLRAYIYTLNRLDHNYSIYLCNNRINGGMVYDFKSWTQVSLLAFSIDEVEPVKFYLPRLNSNVNFRSDEIPPWFQGSTAVRIAMGKKYAIAEPFVLPYETDEKNIRYIKAMGKVNVADREIDIKWHETLKGSYEWSPRFNSMSIHDWDYYDWREEKYSHMDYDIVYGQITNMDTLWENDLLKFEFEMNLRRCMKPVAGMEGVYQLDLGRLILHEYEMAFDTARKQDYNLEFPRREQFDFYLVFPPSTEFLNIDSVKFTHLQEGVGSYNFDVKRVNEKVLLIQSFYQLAAWKIKAEEIKSLKYLNEAAITMLARPLLFKIDN